MLARFTKAVSASAAVACSAASSAAERCSSATARCVSASTDCSAANAACVCASVGLFVGPVALHDGDETCDQRQDRDHAEPDERAAEAAVLSFSGAGPFLGGDPLGIDETRRRVQERGLVGRQ